MLKSRKIALLSLLVILLPLNSFGQKLSLEQMTSLYQKDIDDISDYLIQRGWDYGGTKDGGESVKWTYNGLASADLAQCFFYVFSYTSGSRKGVGYQGSKQDVEIIKNRVQELKMRKLASGLDDTGNVYSIYLGAKYGVKFVVTKDIGRGSTTYVQVYDKYYFSYHPDF